jgi:hypothetical protein
LKQDEGGASPNECLMSKHDRQKHELIAVKRTDIARSYNEYIKENPRIVAFKVENVYKWL